MPSNLLEYLSRKITTQHFEQGEYICHKGDEGHCLYIIYSGAIEVLINGKVVQVFLARELVGRTALETEAKRNADLRAKEPSDILLL